VLALGEALVAELGLDQSNDVLGRWMAHHLAGLIEKAKVVAPEERAEAEDRCFAAVLEVWRHRNCLPHGHRPFEPMERVLDVITALDPDEPRPFYNRIALNWDDLDDVDLPTPNEKQLLDVVREFDQVARDVLQHLLARAVEGLPEDTRVWVQRAQAAGLGGRDLTAIRRLILLSGKLAAFGRQQQDAHIDALRSQLDQLERFVETAKVVRDNLAGRLAAAEAERSASEEVKERGRSEEADD